MAEKIHYQKLCLLYVSEPSGNDIVNDLHVSFSPFESWVQPVQSSVRPSPRSSHVTVTIDCQYYVYGGAADNTMWELTIPEFKWTGYSIRQGNAKGNPPRENEQRYYAGLAACDRKVDIDSTYVDCVNRN